MASDQPLGYGRTYTMTITARGPAGMPSRETSSFTTLSPDYQAAVYLDTTAGAPIQDGGTTASAPSSSHVSIRRSTTEPPRRSTYG